MRAQRLLLPSTERHRERASRVLVADTGVGQHAPDERTTVRRRRNLPLRLAGVGVIVVRFAARLSGRRDKKSFLSKNGRGQDHLLLASSTAGYQLLSCATSWHRCRVRRDAGRVQTAGCSAKADAASQVPSMQKTAKKLKQMTEPFGARALLRATSFFKQFAPVSSLSAVRESSFV